jgi:hypothetical protein
MHVRVVRRGGLAGIPMRGEVETTELAQTPDHARAIEDALRGLPVDRPPAAPSHPDGFQYAIEFADGGGEPRSVTLDESEVSDELRPLIQQAMQRGTLG